MIDSVMFKVALSAMNIESSFQSLLDTVWAYGNDVKLKVVAQTQRFCMVKMLASGSVQWIMFPMEDLLSASRTMKGV